MLNKFLWNDLTDLKNNSKNNFQFEDNNMVLELNNSDNQSLLDNLNIKSDSLTININIFNRSIDNHRVDLKKIWKNFN
tara:strand:- start:102 stop:335 length:234 start_codon:yes stop_codon:yes gene_type:complete